MIEVERALKMEFWPRRYTDMIFIQRTRRDLYGIKDSN
jgi:hypothetical protein